MIGAAAAAYITVHKCLISLSINCAVNVEPSEDVSACDVWPTIRKRTTEKKASACRWSALFPLHIVSTCAEHQKERIDSQVLTDFVDHVLLSSPLSAKTKVTSNECAHLNEEKMKEASLVSTASNCCFKWAIHQRKVISNK